MYASRLLLYIGFFFFNDTATPEIYTYVNTLSLHDALPISAIYEWIPGQGEPRRLLLTSDALIECQPIADDLLCLRERSRRPRHFVRLQLATGQIKEIFDPNPYFSNLSLVRVERLNCLNAENVPFYGDLVYPVLYVPVRRSPIVIVQFLTYVFFLWCIAYV